MHDLSDGTGKIAMLHGGCVLSDEVDCCPRDVKWRGEATGHSNGCVYSSPCIMNLRRIGAQQRMRRPTGAIPRGCTTACDNENTAEQPTSTLLTCVCSHYLCTIITDNDIGVCAATTSVLTYMGNRYTS